MKKGFALGALAVGALVVSSFAFAGEGDSVKSGPQVGQKIKGAFHPFNVTGRAAGRKNCLT